MLVDGCKFVLDIRQLVVGVGKLLVAFLQIRVCGEFAQPQAFLCRGPIVGRHGLQRHGRTKQRQCEFVVIVRPPSWIAEPSCRKTEDQNVLVDLPQTRERRGPWGTHSMKPQERHWKMQYFG
jgi:hypothetical protein